MPADSLLIPGHPGCHEPPQHSGDHPCQQTPCKQHSNMQQQQQACTACEQPLQVSQHKTEHAQLCCASFKGPTMPADCLHAATAANGRMRMSA